MVCHIWLPLFIFFNGIAGLACILSGIRHQDLNPPPLSSSRLSLQKYLHCSLFSFVKRSIFQFALWLCLWHNKCNEHIVTFSLEKKNKGRVRPKGSSIYQDDEGDLDPNEKANRKEKDEKANPSQNDNYLFRRLVQRC